MIVYRCLNNKFLADPLSPIGAMSLGGRFNSVGIPVVYTAEHRAMAIFEILTRLPIETIIKTYSVVPIEVPDTPSFIISPWGDGWQNEAVKCLDLGDHALSDKNNLLIQVPSSLLNNCFNYLINPQNSEFHTKIKPHDAEPIIFDERIIKNMLGGSTL